MENYESIVSMVASPTDHPKIIHAESVYCDITDELKRLFYQLFHETEIEFRSFVVLLAYIKRLQCKSAKESIF